MFFISFYSRPPLAIFAIRSSSDKREFDEMRKGWAGGAAQNGQVVLLMLLRKLWQGKQETTWWQGDALSHFDQRLFMLKQPNSSM